MMRGLQKRRRSSLPVKTKRSSQNLTVWMFRSTEAARGTLDVLRGLQRERVLTIHEAAVIEWPRGRREPETREFQHVDADGDRSRVWRGLFRALFDVEEPIAALFRDLGVDDRLLGEVRWQMQPETSALFILTSGGFYRELEPSFRDFGATLLYTTLPERRIRRLSRRLEGDAATRR
jgi:uncharacterized membrane protein